MVKQIRDRLLARNTKNSSDDGTLKDWHVFSYLDDKNNFDLIRAFIDGKRRIDNFHSYLVHRPQIQLCVKTRNSITSYDVCKDY